MLQTLREKTSGWIAGAILGLLIVPFLFVFDTRYLTGVSRGNLAQVTAPPTWWVSAPNWWPVSLLWQRRAVSTQDFTARFDQIRSQTREQMGDRFDAQAFDRPERKRQILEQLIDEQLLSLAADRAGITIADEQVFTTIANIPQFQIKGQFNQSQYLDVLTKLNPPRTATTFEKMVRDSLQTTFIPQTVATSGFVTQEEGHHLLALIGQTRDIEVADLPKPSLKSDPVSNDQIHAWYQTHLPQYRQPEQVWLDYILVGQAQLPAAAPVTEQVLRERYASNQGRFLHPEQRHAAHILIRSGNEPAAQQAAKARAQQIVLEARQPGADFAQLAKRYSQDPGSKDHGGDLGWVEPGGMVKPFDAALFAMQTGDIVGPIQTPFGYHIIQLQAIMPAQGQSFDQVRDRLADEVRQSQAHAALQQLVGQLVDLANQHPNALDGLAQMAKVTVQHLGPIARENPTGIANSPAVLRAAFSGTLIQDQSISDPIALGPDQHVFLRVTQHSLPQQLPLTAVRDRVIAEIQTDRLDRAAAAQADSWVDQMRHGASLSTLAKAQAIPTRTLTGLQRVGDVAMAALNQAVFSVPVPQAGSVSAGRARIDDGHYAVFGLTKVTPADSRQLSPDQVRQVTEELSANEGAVAARQYLAALRRQYQVQVQEQP